MVHRKIIAWLTAASVLIAPNVALGQKLPADQQSLDCRSYCAAPAGGFATLHASWPSLQKNERAFRLYLSTGPEAIDEKSDGVIIEMSRRSIDARRLTTGANIKKKRRAKWVTKQKPMSTSGAFENAKAGRLETFASSRGRNRADYAIVVDGLTPLASYYLRLEVIGGKTSADPLEAYCVITTCPGHDEGGND